MRRVNVLIVAPMLGEDAVEVITEVCPEADVTRVSYYESVERRQARHAGLAGPPENEDLPDGMLEAMAEAEVIVSLVLPPQRRGSRAQAALGAEHRRGASSSTSRTAAPAFGRTPSSSPTWAASTPTPSPSTCWA